MIQLAELPPIKRQLYEAVKCKPGITARELRALIWADNVTDTRQLHILVAQLNTLLRPFGATIRSEAGGYQIRHA